MNFKIGFIGAGKVGVTLGKYFSTNNIEVCGYYSKTEASSKEAAEFTNSKIFSSLEQLTESCNMIFITTPDDMIENVWLNIKNYNINNKILCHTSGSFSSSIFSSIDTSGAYGYSIHPLYPFSDKYTSYINLKNAYFSLEGHPKFHNEIRTLFETLGNKVISLDSSNKELYHLSNVTVSNLVLSLLEIGTGYLEQCNVDSKEAFNALLPLIETNLTNIKNRGFEAALTGPIERGDIKTIEKHLKVIPEKDEDLYKRLSLNLVKLAESKNKEKEQKYTFIKNELGG